MNNVILKKDDQKIPDFFTVTINYVTGKSETLKVANRFVIGDFIINDKGFIIQKNIDSIEFLTFEDTYKLIPMQNVLSIDYHKDYTEYVEIERELKSKEATNGA